MRSHNQTRGWLRVSRCRETKGDPSNQPDEGAVGHSERILPCSRYRETQLNHDTDGLKWPGCCNHSLQ
jgi:hypothetical protein